MAHRNRPPRLQVVRTAATRSLQPGVDAGGHINWCGACCALFSRLSPLQWVGRAEMVRARPRLRLLVGSPHISVKQARFNLLPNILDSQALLDGSSVWARQRAVDLVAVLLGCQLAQVPLERVHREPGRSTASAVVISTLPSAFCTRFSATRGVSAISRTL